MGIRKALEVGACNSLLLKVNQIGSISEAIEAATMSQKKWLERHGVAPIWRNRRHFHCRSCGGSAGWTDQNWRTLSFRAACQIQPTDSYRGRAWPSCNICRHQ